MSWQCDINSAESLLNSTRVPPSEEIIALIKRINPTSLLLSETDRELGYRTKNRLQNLLLVARIRKRATPLSAEESTCYPDAVEAGLAEVEACPGESAARCSWWWEEKEGRHGSHQ